MAAYVKWIGYLPKKDLLKVKHIYEHEIPELERCYAKFPGRSIGNHLSESINSAHPDLGAFQASNLMLPNLFLLDMHWSIPDALILHESKPSETIDINFILEGNIEGDFRGLNTAFAMRGGSHNLKYTPSEKSVHRALKQETRMFVLSIEKKYFCDLIGCNDPWAEGIHRKIDRNENFFGSNTFLPSNPKMLGLIHAIRTMEPVPQSRLLIQSMLFELLAHQIDQFRSVLTLPSPVDDLTANDIEKLYNVRLYIDQHFLDDLTLTSLCRQSLLNEFKLKKGFKALFNTTVIKYVKALRMQYAQTLLQNSRVSVTEVAILLGYQYPNHFSVAYKKHFGVTPSSTL